MRVVRRPIVALLSLVVLLSVLVWRWHGVDYEGSLSPLVAPLPLESEDSTEKCRGCATVVVTPAIPPTIEGIDRMNLSEIARLVRGRGNLGQWRAVEISPEPYLDYATNETLRAIERIAHLSHERNCILMIWIWLNTTVEGCDANNTMRLSPERTVRTFYPFLQPRVLGDVVFALRWDTPRIDVEEDDFSDECLLLYATRFEFPQDGTYRLSTHLTHQPHPVRTRSSYNSGCWVPQEIIPMNYTFNVSASSVVTSSVSMTTSPPRIYWKLPREYRDALDPPVNGKFLDERLHTKKKLISLVKYRRSDGKRFDRIGCRERVILPRLRQYDYDQTYVYPRVVATASPTDSFSPSSRNGTTTTANDTLPLPPTTSPTTKWQYNPWTPSEEKSKNLNYSTFWFSPSKPKRTPRSFVCFLGDSHLRYYANEMYAYIFNPSTPQLYLPKKHRIPVLPDFIYYWTTHGEDFAHPTIVLPNTFRAPCTHVFMNFGLWTLWGPHDVSKFERRVESAMLHLLSVFPDADSMVWVAIQPCAHYDASILSQQGSYSSATCPPTDFRNAGMILKLNRMAANVIDRIFSRRDEMGALAREANLRYLDLTTGYRGVELLTFDACHFAFPIANPSVDELLGMFFPECVVESRDNDTGRWSEAADYLKHLSGSFNFSLAR